MAFPHGGFSSTAQAWVGTPRAFCPRTNGVVPAKTKKLAVSQKKQRCNQGKTWEIPWFWGLPRNFDIASPRWKIQGWICWFPAGTWHRRFTTRTWSLFQAARDSKKLGSLEWYCGWFRFLLLTSIHKTQQRYEIDDFFQLVFGGFLLSKGRTLILLTQKFQLRIRVSWHQRSMWMI